MSISRTFRLCFLESKKSDSNKVEWGLMGYPGRCALIKPGPTMISVLEGNVAAFPTWSQW